MLKALGDKGVAIGKIGIKVKKGCKRLRGLFKITIYNHLTK